MLTAILDITSIKARHELNGNLEIELLIRVKPCLRQTYS